MAPGWTLSWQLTARLMLKERRQADRHAQSCLVLVECTASICWIITEQCTSSMLQLVWDSGLQCGAAMSPRLPSAGCDRAE